LSLLFDLEHSWNRRSKRLEGSTAKSKSIPYRPIRTPETCPAFSCPSFSAPPLKAHVPPCSGGGLLSWDTHWRQHAQLMLLCWPCLSCLPLQRQVRVQVTTVQCIDALTHSLTCYCTLMFSCPAPLKPQPAVSGLLAPD